MINTRNASGRWAGRLLSAASAAVVALSLGAAATPVVAGEQSLVEHGKQLAFDRKKGNCLACHMIPGGESPGNIGPPLVAMKARFPERQRLFNQIWDATAINPNTMMPPFGLHKALSKEEVDAIVEFLYTI
jgi:sulfur-oxidizing protein SoxX